MDLRDTKVHIFEIRRLVLFQLLFPTSPVMSRVSPGIPVIPSIALVLWSFLCSSVVLAKIFASIWHSKSQKLTTANKSIIWLVLFDITALFAFVMQVILTKLGNSPSYDPATNPISAARMWVALTARQTCFLIVTSVTLLHIRLARPISLGPKHIFLWFPTSIIIVISTITASGFAAGSSSFYPGIIAYLLAISLCSTFILSFLIYTLFKIGRSTSKKADDKGDDPSYKIPYNSRDIEALREGSSWLTSDASSARRSTFSAWSFPSTASRSNPSIYNNSTKSTEEPPPVPQVPSLYREQQGTIYRSKTPNSWLTSLPSSHRRTMSSFSFPTSRANTFDNVPGSIRLVTPSTLQLRPSSSMLKPRSKRYPPKTARSEPFHSLAMPFPSKHHQVTLGRAFGWLIMTWLPFVSFQIRPLNSVLAHFF